MKERYICTLPKVVDEIDVLLLVLHGHDPAGANNQLAGEEVRRFEAEDKWLVFVPNIVGMRCGTSAPTMPFRSVGSHQRTIFFLSTALEFSFSFIQPSVTAEHRRLPNVGKASLINTLKRVSDHRRAQQGAFRGTSAGGTYEGVTICLTRAYATDRTKHGLGLLRNVAKPKGVDNLTSDDMFCALPPISAPLKLFSYHGYPPLETS
ncbi:hypothetical protein EDB86DRAFT_2835763 [Lactarius hatsudake]|nr:hypothetical protein EDB86DRAFT_2835763 [Lactarius hatsudake]